MNKFRNSKEWETRSNKSYVEFMREFSLKEQYDHLNDFVID